MENSVYFITSSEKFSMQWKLLSLLISLICMFSCRFSLYLSRHSGFVFHTKLNLLHLKIRNLNNCFTIQRSQTEDIYWSARNVFIFLRVWSFRRIQKRIFDPRFAGPRGRKEREIRNWICSLGNLSQKCVICMTASQEMTCFLLFDKLCDYTV